MTTPATQPSAARDEGQTAKTQFVLKYISAYWEKEHSVARDRVAYLLRAARSRRSNNVLRNGRCYRLLDCGVRISSATGGAQ
jgi:hypothetical protein